MVVTWGRVLAVITSLGAGAAALATGAYTVGRDTGAKELDVYKAMKDANLQEMSASIVAAAKSMATSAEAMAVAKEVKENFDRLKTANVDLRVKIAGLEATVAERDRSIADLTGKLKKLSGADERRHELKVGVTERLLPQSLNVALKSVSANYATLLVNGAAEILSAGERKTHYVQNRECTIELTDVSAKAETATIVFYCK